MPDNRDRKRAEEIAANALTLTDLESIGGLSLRKLIDAITTFASEVRQEQKERDAKIADVEKRKAIANAKDRTDPDYDDGYGEAAQFVAAAIRNEVEPK